MNLVTNNGGLESDARHGDAVLVVVGRRTRDGDASSALERGKLRYGKSYRMRVVCAALDVVALGRPEVEIRPQNGQ